MPQTYFIDDPKQLKELTSPVRQVILNALAASPQPLTMRELADDINRPADGLYYHVRSLVRSGLVLEQTAHTEQGRTIAAYQAAGRRFRIKYNFAMRHFKKLMKSIVAAAGRLAHRDFERALELEDVRAHSADRNLHMARLEGWLTRKQLEAVNRKIEEINEIVTTSVPSPRAERCSLFIALSPLAMKDRE